tara:strand:- start:1042 stop:1488 length:447 start_codon:yes stop_codon:yes gene_type:complete
VDLFFGVLAEGHAEDSTIYQQLAFPLAVFALLNYDFHDYYSFLFLFALPTHEIFKVVPFGSFIVVDVVLLAASATSAGNQFSVGVGGGLKNLFASNVHISHNWKQYSTVSENCNTLFHFFLFFLAHDLAHNMLCLGGPARGGRVNYFL